MATKIFKVLSLALLLAGPQLASAQKPSTPHKGMLGIYAEENDFGGMYITGFIENTPASKINIAGRLNKGDVIVKLAGKETDTMQELIEARDSIPYGKKGKMIVRHRHEDGSVHKFYVWISRKGGSHAYAAGSPAAAAAADGFSYGGAGEGKGKDIIDGDESGSESNQDSGSSTSDDDGPDIM